MDTESKPEPLPLSSVKELLEKQLDVRENRLRCVECGNFQSVPEEVPESSKEDESDDDSEEFTGPVCEKCDSSKMNLIEQIQYEHKLALDHARSVSKASVEESKLIIEKVSDLEHVDDYYAIKIADVLPMHPDEVRSLFARERFSLGRDEIDAIITAVKETMGA